MCDELHQSGVEVQKHLTFARALSSSGALNSPLPLLCSLLLFLLPLVGLLGRSLAHFVSGDRSTRAVLAPAFALAPWLLIIHLLGRISHSFLFALIAGTSLTAIAGLMAFVRQRKSTLTPTGSSPSRWMYVAAILAATLIAPFAFGRPMHDEIKTTGHMSIAGQILNDIYPPRHLTFPHAELNYHYGFDLLVAVTSALTRLRVDHAIDAVVLLCWAWTFCVAWVIGRRAARARGLMAATVLLFGGGIPILCAPNHVPTVAELIGSCKIDGLWVNPPLSSYFFQHPWTLGLPIALSIILLLGERKTRAIPRLLGVSLLVLMLSLSQFTLFTTLGASIVAQAFFAADGPPKRWLARLLGAPFSPGRGFAMLAAVLVAFLAATQLGGFFARDTDLGGPALVRHAGVTESFSGTILWITASFGLLLPLGILGLALVPRLRVLGLCLLSGSLLVINTLRVQATWDIVKFATVTAIAASLFAGVLIDRVFSIRRRWLGLPLGIVLLAGSTAAGFAYPILIGLDLKSLPKTLERNVAPLSGADAEVASFLRGRVREGDLVYRAKVMTVYYAIWAGLPQVWLDQHSGAFGFSRARLNRRAKLLQSPPSEIEPYLAEHIRFFVLDPALDGALVRYADAWIAAGRAREIMNSGKLRVVEALR